jgi:hypothetical protein
MGGRNMNVSEMVLDSLKFPFSDLKRLLGLGILSAASVLVIPIIFTMGYNLRIIEYSFKGSNELPPFNKWWDMFVDGLKYLIVMIIYIGIPSIIVSIISVFIIMVILLSGQVSDFNTFLKTSFQILFVVSIVLMAVPYLLRLIALPHIVKNNKIGAAIKFKEIFAIIKNIGWINYISGAVVITAVAMVVSALNTIPQLLHMGQITVWTVSMIVGFFLGSYTLAFRGKLQALLYQEGYEEENQEIGDF